MLGKILGAAMLLACLGLVVGCTATSPGAKTGDGRNGIPLIAPLTPEATIVEFQIAPVTDSEPKPAFIGLRFAHAISDVKPDINAQRAYRHAFDRVNIDARINLTRITDAGPVPIPLARIRFDTQRRQNVSEPAPDGLVRTLVANSADTWEMQQAGLEPPGKATLEYTLARVPPLTAGRYRIELRFLQLPNFPAGPTPELIVAHDAPDK